MSRKRRKKKYNLSKARFKQKVCKKCLLCNGGDDTFCFDMYSGNQKEFLKVTVPQLHALSGWETDVYNEDYFDYLDMFSYLFCDTVCPNKDASAFGHCLNIMQCFSEFEEQLLKYPLEDTTSIHTGRKTREEKGFKKVKQSTQKKPTLFFSDEALWRARIDTMVKNANTDIKQDKDNESSESTAGVANNQTAGT